MGGTLSSCQFKITYLPGWKSKLLDLFSRFYWKYLEKYCKIFVLSFDACQKFEIGSKGFHPQHSISADWPMQHLWLDTFVPLPSTIFSLQWMSFHVTARSTFGSLIVPSLCQKMNQTIRKRNSQWNASHNSCANFCPGIIANLQPKYAGPCADTWEPLSSFEGLNYLTSFIHVKCSWTRNNSTALIF